MGNKLKPTLSEIRAAHYADVAQANSHSIPQVLYKEILNRENALLYLLDECIKQSERGEADSAYPIEW